MRTHGKASNYRDKNYACRCEACTIAHTERSMQERKKRTLVGLLPDDPRHGTVNAYRNFGCRCESCTKANTEYNRQRRTS